MKSSIVASIILSTAVVHAQPAPDAQPAPAPAAEAQPPAVDPAKLEELQRQNAQLAQRLDVLAAQTAQLAAEQAKPAPKPTPSRIRFPEWITGFEDRSDFRLRLDDIYQPDPSYVGRKRYRPRLRLAGIVSLENNLEIGVRVASSPTVAKDSGGDPLSTNQSWEDNASRKPMAVDWAFVRWTPIRTKQVSASIAVGKLDNPPNVTEDVFDVDYTPEGAVEVVSWKLHPDHTADFYFGQYILDEIQFSPHDPFLVFQQLHLTSSWSHHFTTTATVDYLAIGHAYRLTTANVPDSNHGNTRDASGALTNHYHVLVADLAVTFKLDNVAGYRGAFPITLYAEYIKNYGASANNLGYSVGPTLGKVSQARAPKCNWELSYRYQHLEGDANYEELTASDNGAFYRSNPVNEPVMSTFRPTFLNGLNLRGHAFRAAFAPLDSMVLDLRIWRNEAINVAAAAERVAGTRLMFDAIWRF